VEKSGLQLRIVDRRSLFNLTYVVLSASASTWKSVLRQIDLASKFPPLVPTPLYCEIRGALPTLTQWVVVPCYFQLIAAKEMSDSLQCPARILRSEQRLSAC
jgi:hypothetical protein